MKEWEKTSKEFHDISALQQKLLDMDRRLLLAQEESLRKSAFLSQMSHEIRTPMSGIIGLVQLVQNQTEKGSQMDGYLKKIRALSEHLLLLLDHILDLSRMEAGKTALEEKKFDLAELAEKLHSMFCESIRAKGIDFTVELQDFDCTDVVGDELRLSQVLMNLLSNARKFTQEGEIRLTMRQIHRDDHSIDLMMVVHDTGIGMEAEFLNRIFRPFEQENADIGRVFGGSGLGMAIADQMIRLMGGEISVTSMPQKGTDVTVFLNLETGQGGKDVQNPEQRQDKTVSVPLKGMHILLAEDNEINAMVAAELLSGQGAVVERAADGKQALELFECHRVGYFDLILMDVQMPGMDGRESAGKIRALPRPDAEDILIFALSADGFKEDAQRSFACGMDAHLVKPLDFSNLGKEIAKAREYRARRVIQ